MMWGVLIVAVVVAGLRWQLAERADDRRRWLDRMYGARSGTLGVGISALVVGEQRLERCEALLEEEYAPFEVVLILNFERSLTLVEDLHQRYHLIRVEYHPSGEFPVRGVQGLYRSRKRRFRRLVVVDCRAPGERAALDVGADVASYDYLLPLRRHEQLVPGGVARLATELARQPLNGVDQLIYAPMLRCLVWHRAALMRVGGFPCRRSSLTLSARRVVVWERYLRGYTCLGGWCSAILLTLLLLLVGVVVWLQCGTWFPLAAWGVVLLFVVLCRARIRQLDRLQL